METFPFEIGETAHALRKAFDPQGGRTWRYARAVESVVPPGAAGSRASGRSSLADMLDVEPITLTRILDRLEEAHLVDRRPDPADRRAWRLDVTAEARPLIELKAVGADLAADAFGGIDPKDIEIARQVLGRQPREDAIRCTQINRASNCNKMATEPMTGTEAAETPQVKKAPKRSLRTIVMLIVPAILLAIGGYYWFTSGGSVSTDDAQVKQDIVSVSPQVNGQVVEVHVRNGARVKRGDLLFRIDPQPYRVALEQAEADAASAHLQTQALRTTAAGTSGDITGAQANLSIKRNALNRQQALLGGLHHLRRL